MKTLVFGVGNFGFAILNHISKNNKEEKFYAYDKDNLVVKKLIEKREHPYFFSGIKLGNNIEFIEDLPKTLPYIDLFIISVPTQFVVDSIDKIQSYLKPGVTFLNLSKGICNKDIKTIGELLSLRLFPRDFNYGVLSGGMLAGELVDGVYLGADLAIEDISIGKTIKYIFENDKLEIKLFSKDIKNIELYGAFKNVIAMCIGYYEGIGYKSSSLGYFLCKLYNELSILVNYVGGNKNLDFSYFSLGGDIIASCFGDSRNRLFGRFLGEGKNTKEILEIFEKENKIAEGYETFSYIYVFTKEKNEFKEINKIGKHLF